MSQESKTDEGTLAYLHDHYKHAYEEEIIRQSLLEAKAASYLTPLSVITGFLWYYIIGLDSILISGEGWKIISSSLLILECIFLAISWYILISILTPQKYKTRPLGDDVNSNIQGTNTKYAQETFLNLYKTSAIENRATNDRKVKRIRFPLYLSAASFLLLICATIIDQYNSSERVSIVTDEKKPTPSSNGSQNESPKKQPIKFDTVQRHHDTSTNQQELIISKDAPQEGVERSSPQPISRDKND
jgi:hypothetical protein